MTSADVYQIAWEAAASMLKKLADDGDLAVRPNAIVALAPDWFVEAAGMQAELAEMERQRDAL